MLKNVNLYFANELSSKSSRVKFVIFRSRSKSLDHAITLGSRYCLLFFSMFKILKRILRLRKSKVQLFSTSLMRVNRYKQDIAVLFQTF